MKNKRLLKNWSKLLALVICMFIFPSSAFASEPLLTEKEQVKNLEEVGISREEACKLLDLSIEEAKDVKFYVLNADDHLVIDANDPDNNPYKFPSFTFTDDNVGNYFTVNGDKLMYAVVWNISDDQPAATLDVELYPYGEERAYNLHLTTDLEAVGDQEIYAKSPWIDTYYGVDYHFIYTADAWAWDPRSVRSTVTMIVGVV